VVVAHWADESRHAGPSYRAVHRVAGAFGTGHEGAGRPTFFFGSGKSRRCQAFTEVDRVTDLISFEPDKIMVLLDDKQLHLEPGQIAVSHGIDRELTLHELSGPEQSEAPTKPTTLAHK
jgi:hypothetical protein